jgi:hypothetical protein
MIGGVNSRLLGRKLNKGQRAIMRFVNVLVALLRASPQAVGPLGRRSGQSLTQYEFRSLAQDPESVSMVKLLLFLREISQLIYSSTIQTWLL